MSVRLSIRRNSATSWARCRAQQSDRERRARREVALPGGSAGVAARRLRVLLDMHSKDARLNGETEQRLYLLDAWREAPMYSERERAALAWQRR